MTPWERELDADERALAQAFETVGAFPGLRADQRAAFALDLLARKFDLSALKRAQRLARTGALISASLDFERVVEQTLELGIELMAAERALLVLRDGYRAARPETSATDGSFPQTTIEGVIASGQSVFATDPQPDPNLEQRAVTGLHVRSIGCVPLRARGETIGALCVDARAAPGLFTRGDRDALLSFALQAAAAIENARAYGSQARILEAIASGIITLSADDAIASFNRAAEKTFGVSAGTFIGRPADELEALVPAFAELMQTFRESGAVALRAETDGIASNGRQLVLEVRISPLDEGHGQGAALVFADVSANRALEAAHSAEIARAKTIEAAFSRYLAPHVVQSLIHNPASVRLGGDRSLATMLFADVRGFTALAATLPAERVLEILNAYFEVAVKVIFEHDGLLDKFYGDGLMAVFGPPRVQENDAARAVAAALDLHRVVRELNPNLDYPLKISVGLATGEVVAGHLGSSQRMDYTVIGDAVNRANGLQSAAPPGAVYCDQETYDRAGPIGVPAHRLAARIKNRADLQTVYAMFPDDLLSR
jgi:adenylate cyclase